ncbi:hypothetical protein BU23DRAFT_446693 [Bimuria novae-zelandiae CBS 107.79]|uniref:Uncharacterized protein n=1 Tax=Bimuria novae-zelandiae CBS 107.79 TaxID=1447943 RepID=A0A6A5W3C0_9PLEO|nr:hypothetical protein BU23DRAFT_446693 [Bimuria novae-zelandiae CBS 107.79]
MIVTGILLLPTVFPHAVQDLADLKTVIDSTAAIIDAAPNNSSWGFFGAGSPAGSLGTADLIANISTSILRAKYLLDVDKVAWITIPSNTPVSVNTTQPSPAQPDTNAHTPTASTPTGPESTKPTPPPPATPKTDAPALNTSLDAPYTFYISSIPTLANALNHLGRSWHKELNSPVAAAIDALQQTLTQFSTSMLEAELLGSASILRTIRASSSLESAQVAWGRALNLPGTAPVRREVEVVRPPLAKGEFYTHKELWGTRAVGEKVGKRFVA